MGQEEHLSGDLAASLEDHRSERTAPSGTVVLSESEGYVDDDLTVLGRNFPADTDLELAWGTVNGDWGVIEGNEILGPQYRPTTRTLATVTTDDEGEFEHSLSVPEDYGGGHTLSVQDSDGQTLAEAEYEITPHFVLDRTTAALGEAFTLTGYGLGPNPLTNNYQVAWDNGTVGFLTGVMNNGTATAEVRAVGPSGPHTLQVWRNYRGVPFLQNNTQSPYGPVAGGRQSVWTVEVTDPETRPETAWMDPQLDETPLPVHYPNLDRETDATLEITPTSGQPGTSAFLAGEAFPPDTEVDLVWHRHQGHRVKGIPITPEPRPDVLPTVTTDADGAFRVEVEVPSDIGSTRPITAEIAGESVAVTGFMLQPEIVDISPTAGPVGTPIEIEIAAVGWTVYENAPYFVYDNQPVGYACGVDDDDADGITRVRLRAAGEPGLHCIDAYPSLFDVREDEPDFELKPHLSYLDNHPVRPLPAFHFTFEVTE